MRSAWTRVRAQRDEHLSDDRFAGGDASREADFQHGIPETRFHHGDTATQRKTRLEKIQVFSVTL